VTTNLLTRPEVAKRLRVSERTLDRLNDEADDLAGRLLRLSVSPDNVPKCGDAA
jgi:hypothetical protein